MSTAANIFKTFSSVSQGATALKETSRRSDILKSQAETASRSVDIAQQEANRNFRETSIFQKPYDRKAVAVAKTYFGSKGMKLERALRPIFEPLDEIDRIDIQNEDEGKPRMTVTEHYTFFNALVKRNLPLLRENLLLEAEMELNKNGKSVRYSNLLEFREDISSSEFAEKMGYPVGTPDYIALKARGGVKQTFVTTKGFRKGKRVVVQTPVGEGETGLGDLETKSDRELQAIKLKEGQAKRTLEIREEGLKITKDKAKEAKAIGKIKKAITSQELRTRLATSGITRDEAIKDVEAYNLLGKSGEIAYWSITDIKHAFDVEKVNFVRLDKKWGTPAQIQEKANKENMTVYKFLLSLGLIPKLAPRKK